jgi:NADPH:quinone reductase-like Zn-dependent oxidoreductase
MSHRTHVPIFAHADVERRLNVAAEIIADGLLNLSTTAPRLRSQQAFKRLRVVPPDVGIVDQINLERLARVVFEERSDQGPRRLQAAHVLALHGRRLAPRPPHRRHADLVRVPHADNSLHAAPPGVDDAALAMLSDILPTGFEVGARNGGVNPGAVVAIVGAGPICLAALLTAQLYSPAELIVVDLDPNRLAVAKALGATALVDAGDGHAAQRVLERTGGRGVDVAIEAVGVPASFDVCQDVLAAGGRLANVGVHGKNVALKLESVWSRNVTITTGLVDTDTTPMLLKSVVAGRLAPQRLVSHERAFGQLLEAYELFEHAAQTRALKIVLRAQA